MTTESATVGGEIPEPQSGEDLCRPFVDLLPVTGASVSVIGGPGQHSTIYASDVVAARVDSLQYELGEGPRWKTLRTGQPVLIADVRGEPHPEWPVFGAAAIEAGIGALFAFPLVMGAATIGVVDLYRSSPGALSAEDVQRTLSIAASVAASAVHRAVWSAGEDAPREMVAELRREVHQATGMILVQLDISATDAFVRLRAHAFSNGRSVEEVARDVVMRRLDFRDLAE